MMIKGMELRESVIGEEDNMKQCSHLIKRVLKEQRGQDRRIENRREKPLFFNDREMWSFCIGLAKESILAASDFMKLAEKHNKQGWADSIIKVKLVQVAESWKV